MTTDESSKSTSIPAADVAFVDAEIGQLQNETLNLAGSEFEDNAPISGQVLINVGLSAAHVFLAFDPKALENARRTELLNQAIRRGFVAPKASTK